MRVKAPTNLYIAELDIDTDKVMSRINLERLEQGRNELTKKLKLSSLVMSELRSNKIYDKDIVIKGSKMFTFINLNKDTTFIQNIIDQGTIEGFDVGEFYNTGLDEENIVLDLLKRSFVDDCYHKGISEDQDRKVLRFRMNKGDVGPKSVRWKDRKSSTKAVIQALINKKEGHVICYRHLAFNSRFYRFNNEFYLSIKPTYSFTDPGGYKTSRFGSDYMTGIKRIENNFTVYYAFKIIEFVLCKKDLFYSNSDILILEPILPFKLTPSIHDEVWLQTDDVNTDESIDQQNNNDNPQLTLEL